MNQLDPLRRRTPVVADAGSFRQLAPFAPQDATIQPSPLLRAVPHRECAPLPAGTAAAPGDAPLAGQVDAMPVRLESEVLRIVPGGLSTQVDVSAKASAPSLPTPTGWTH